MYKEDLHQAHLLRDTKVLFRINDTDEYYMTNDDVESIELLRIFSANKNGKIFGEGCLFGSVIAHDPYILEDIKDVNCTYEELNPRYFDSNPVIDGLIGQSVGDAFGVPYEFMGREDVRKLDLREMVGCDTQVSFNSRWGDLIPKGAWSDDTSMAVAAMASIIDNNGEVDYDDIMRQFIAWWDNGKFSSMPFPFGLGNTVHNAMVRYKNNYPPLECGGTGVRDNGNGALMRMFPFSMICIMRKYDDQKTYDFIRKASAVTHGHIINALSCCIYTQFLFDCLRTKNPKMSYYTAIRDKEYDYKQAFPSEAINAHEILFKQIMKEDFDPDTIRESGYVVDSLITAIYSIINTENFEDAIKMAVRFGYDTDTNAAITGSLAGVIYGMDSIPVNWLRDLKRKDYLIDIGERFSEAIKNIRQISNK